MKDQEEELVFVYNANKDVVNAIIGYAHKVFSPTTYSCELCSLTHSNLGERKAWKVLKKEEEIKMSFIYKAEFMERFNSIVELPIVLSIVNGNETVLLSKKEIASFTNVNELMSAIRTKMQTKP